MKGFENLNFSNIQILKSSNLQILKFFIQCHRRKNIFLILSDNLTGWAITIVEKRIAVAKDFAWFMA